MTVRIKHYLIYYPYVYIGFEMYYLRIQWSVSSLCFFTSWVSSKFNLNKRPLHCIFCRHITHHISNICMYTNKRNYIEAICILFKPHTTMTTQRGSSRSTKMLGNTIKSYNFYKRMNHLIMQRNYFLKSCYLAAWQALFFFKKMKRKVSHKTYNEYHVSFYKCENLKGSMNSTIYKCFLFTRLCIYKKSDFICNVNKRTNCTY